MHDLPDNLRTYLEAWYSSRAAQKRADGITVTLTYPEFLALFEKRQLASLQKAIDENRLQGQQDRDSPYAYVATWKSYAARSTNVWSKDTACVCSRMKSAAINKPQKGDKLRPSHCQSLSKSLTGVRKSEDHAANISSAKKGQKIAGWSEERKAARSALRKQQEAAKNAAKGGQA